MHANHSNTGASAHNNPFTLPTKILAVLSFIAAVSAAAVAYRDHGLQYAYHAAVPLLPLCGFFALFAYLVNERQKFLTSIALLAAVLAAVLI